MGRNYSYHSGCNGVEEMEWGRGSLLRDLGKRDTNLISVCDCGRGPLLIYVGCYPFSPGVWGVGSWEKDMERFYMGCR